MGLQVSSLTSREWRNLRRDGASLKLRFLLTAFLSVLFSLVFMNVGEHLVLQEVQKHQRVWNAPFLGGPHLRFVQRWAIRQFVPDVNALQQQLQTELEYHYKAVVQVGF